MYVLVERYKAVKGAVEDESGDHSYHFDLDAAEEACGAESIGAVDGIPAVPGQPGEGLLLEPAEGQRESEEGGEKERRIVDAQQVLHHRLSGCGERIGQLDRERVQRQLRECSGDSQP